MAASAWERLAERYVLRDDAGWRQWFDVDSHSDRLAGQFHCAVNLAELCETAPLDIWPGFMLPDSLPIVSNDYGDWWCVRIGESSDIVEVVQWSHGGGDWLPIGKTLAQAALWDYVQQWRGPAIATQQAAHEYPPRKELTANQLHRQPEWHQWMSDSLNCKPQALEDLFQLLEGGRYREALEFLVQRDWSTTAAIGELVELALQGQLEKLADSRLAMHCGINWVPDFTSWLFDTTHIPAEAQQLITQVADDVSFQQDWAAAEHWAHYLYAQRRDLAWPGDVAGWAALRRGDNRRAIDLFFDNRYTSAFTDQSVRLRSHWFAEHLGKFSVAQLHRLYAQLTASQSHDPYLQLLWSEPASRTRIAIREFWLSQARIAISKELFAEGYHYYWQAGWDLGAERMSDYVEILDGLARCATAVGWHGRSAVASMHNECLRRRLSKR